MIVEAVRERDWMNLTTCTGKGAVLLQSLALLLDIGYIPKIEYASDCGSTQM